MSREKQILVVDDEDDIRAVVQVSFEEFAGWRTIGAATGREGIQLAKAAAPDAILLDLSMPDLDGFRVCEALQQDPQTQQIPIIVLTAKVLPGDRQRCQQLNVSGILTKPFDPMLIWQQVAEVLGWSV